MSASTANTVERGTNQGWNCCFHNDRNMRNGSRWGVANLSVMVLSFIFFWPAGLLVLAWILSGRHVSELPAAMRELWSRIAGHGEFKWRSVSSNSVFNDYQQTQYDRISEIKNEIRERAHRFAAFRESAQRRRDQEEFDRFMASAPGREAGSDE